MQVKTLVSTPGLNHYGVFCGFFQTGLSVWLGSHRGAKPSTPQPLGQPVWPGAVRHLRREQLSLSSHCLLHPGASGVDERRAHGGGPVPVQEHCKFSSQSGSGHVCIVSSKSSKKGSKSEILGHYYVMDSRQNYRHRHNRTFFRSYILLRVFPFNVWMKKIQVEGPFFFQLQRCLLLGAQHPSVSLLGVEAEGGGLPFRMILSPPPFFKHTPLSMPTTGWAERHPGHHTHLLFPQVPGRWLRAKVRECLAGKSWLWTLPSSTFDLSVPVVTWVTWLIHVTCMGLEVCPHYSNILRDQICKLLVRLTITNSSSSKQAESKKSWQQLAIPHGAPDRWCLEYKLTEAKAQVPVVLMSITVWPPGTLDIDLVLFI